MNTENKTIHDFELDLICDFFSNMERQGPGSPEVTLRALSFIDNLTDKICNSRYRLWNGWPNNGIGSTCTGTDYRTIISSLFY